MATLNPSSSDLSPLSLVQLQAKFRQDLALGDVSVDREVEMRTLIADMLMEEYERSRRQQDLHDALDDNETILRRQQDLHDAIDHNETILRRLPPSSPGRSERLSKLSHAFMSKYLNSNSRRALEEAVRYGQLAREEAVIAGLKETNPQRYCEILDNIGYALSHRNAAVESAADLDEAIECAREISSCALRHGMDFSCNDNNLVARLRVRYKKHCNPADYEEATQLITKQLSMSAPGTPARGGALVHLGDMAAEKFEQTDAIEDLDKALIQIMTGSGSLPLSYEKRFLLHSRISHLYVSRHKKSSDFADIRNAMLHFDFAVASAPPSDQIRVPYICQFMCCLRDAANATSSSPEIDGEIRIGRNRLEELPLDNPQRHKCKWIFSEVLCRRYLLDRSVDSLIDAVHHIETLAYEYNETVTKSGSEPPVDTSLISAFRSNLMRITHINDGAPKSAATTRLYQLISLAYESKDIVNAVFDVQMEHAKELQVYIDLIESEQVPSEEAVQQRVSELERKEQAKLEKRTSQPQWRPHEYCTELGIRKLAIDPRIQKILITQEQLFAQNVLGYDTTKPMTRDQLVENEARLENETFRKAKAEGKHPNPQLCRMCRIVKPLQPKANEDGFMWEPQVQYMPFGNWNQVSCRHSCSICRLILSCITWDHLTSSLHPCLGNIDWDIQGIGLELAKLNGGETILKVEYGMWPVGQLRILTPSNHTEALRQGWEAKEQSLEFQEVLGKTDGPLHATRGQQVNIVQLKQWLNNCDHNHGSVCNSYRGSGPRYAAEIPIIVIDVIDDCLVEATSAAKYFTLSYVWGSTEMSKTLRVNYAARLQKGGLGSLFPATIADAIALVRSLGERFLWVDTLCIVQDDNMRKQSDIKQMDIIYAKAFATIVAVHDASARAGLPGVNSTSRPPQQVESVTISGRSTDLEFDSDNKDQETVHIVATPRPLHLALEVSALNTRGWILQEQLLSRRCLYFTSRYAYLLCGREVINECGTSEPLPEEWDRPTSADFILPSSMSNPLFNLQGLGEFSFEVRQYKAFAAYIKLVEKYTLRKLSYESDILDAFSGLFAVLNEYLESDIISGLPASILDLVLLWAPATRIPRRGCKLMTMENMNSDLEFDLDFDLGQVNRNFPSWSWAGCTGPTDYCLFAETISAQEPLPTPLVNSYTIEVDGKPQVIPARISEKKTSLDSMSVIPKTGSDSVAGSVPTPVSSPGAPLTSHILQFFAPCVPLTAFTITDHGEWLPRQENIHSGRFQTVRHIHDSRGKRCGLWWEQAGYVYVGGAFSAVAESKMLFVGINQHGDIWRARKGPNKIKGEIHMFDEDVYPAVGKGSGLVNVLAIDLDMGHAYAERITVARIHVKAWEEAGPQMRLVQLA